MLGGQIKIMRMIRLKIDDKVVIAPEDTTILNNELYILENKIKKYKEIIAITEKDLNIINNQ